MKTSARLTPQTSALATPRAFALLRALPLAALLSCAALAHALRAWLGPLDPLLARWPRLCPLYALTDIRCPTCGLGRALIDAAAGDVALAFQHHPLGPLLLAAALAAALVLLLRPALVQRALRVTSEACQRHPRLLAVLVTTYVAWGAARHL